MKINKMLAHKNLSTILGLGVSIGGALHVLLDLLEGGVSTAPYLLVGVFVSLTLLPLLWKLLPYRSEEDKVRETVNIHGLHVVTDALLAAASVVNVVVFVAAIIRIAAHEIVLAPIILKMVGRGYLKRYLTTLIASLVIGSIIGMWGVRYVWFLEVASGVVMLMPALAIHRFRGSLTTLWSTERILTRVLVIGAVILLATTVVVVAHLAHGE
jgi:hypothetical protein